MVVLVSCFLLVWRACLSEMGSMCFLKEQFSNQNGEMDRWDKSQANMCIWRREERQPWSDRKGITRVAVMSHTFRRTSMWTNMKMHVL